jgi:hypothetical protein
VICPNSATSLAVRQYEFDRLPIAGGGVPAVTGQIANHDSEGRGLLGLVVGLKLIQAHPEVEPIGLVEHQLGPTGVMSGSMLSTSSPRALILDHLR